MKGVSYVTNDKDQRTAVIIELKTIEQHPEDIEDLLDGIVAESRKNEPKRSWEEVKASFKEKGKL